MGDMEVTRRRALMSKRALRFELAAELTSPLDTCMRLPLRSETKLTITSTADSENHYDFTAATGHHSHANSRVRVVQSLQTYRPSYIRWRRLR